jgi:uncharacterized membrane protein
MYNRILFILSLAGLAVAGYLTNAHINHLSVACGATSGCDVVAAHSSAWGLGIPFLKALPTAAFGLIGYIALTLLSFLRAAMTENFAASNRLSRLQLLILTFSVGVSAYLTYLEAYVIHAWCKWCVGSACIILVMFLVSLAERGSMSKTELPLEPLEPSEAFS